MARARCHVGGHNYRLLLTDGEFLTSLRVTAILTLIVVIVPNVAGLAVAVLLDRRGWLYNTLRSVFFTPMVLSSVVVSIIWTRMLDGGGLINQALHGLGVTHPPGWLSDPRYALYSLGGDPLLADAGVLRRGLPRRASGRADRAGRGRRHRRGGPGAPVPPRDLAAARARAHRQHRGPADLRLQDLRPRPGHHARRTWHRHHRDDGRRHARHHRHGQRARAEGAAAARGGPVNLNRARAPWLRPLVAIAVSAVFVVPLYVVCVNVIKRGSRISEQPAALPIPPTLENLRSVLTRPDHLFWASLANSTVVTVASILILTVLSAMLGHYLARSRGRWGRVLMLLLLCGLMIPPQVILMPITQVLRAAHLMTTVQGLVLFNVGYYIPFGVFVFSGFMDHPGGAGGRGRDRRRHPDPGVLADRLPAAAPGHRQRADLPGRVDLERLPRPADHPGAEPGHHHHHRHLPRDRAVPGGLRHRVRADVPRHPAGARLLPGAAEALPQGPDGRGDQGVSAGLACLLSVGRAGPVTAPPT